MDEFSTSRPQHLRSEGGGGWTMAAILVVLLVIVAIFGLGVTGNAPSSDVATPTTADPAPQSAPVAAE